jgi:hypothetical protein
MKTGRPWGLFITYGLFSSVAGGGILFGVPRHLIYGVPTGVVGLRITAGLVKNDRKGRQEPACSFHIRNVSKNEKSIHRRYDTEGKKSHLIYMMEKLYTNQSTPVFESFDFSFWFCRWHRITESSEAKKRIFPTKGISCAPGYMNVPGQRPLGLKTRLEGEKDKNKTAGAGSSDKAKREKK